MWAVPAKAFFSHPQWKRLTRLLNSQVSLPRFCLPVTILSNLSFHCFSLSHCWYEYKTAVLCIYNRTISCLTSPCHPCWRVQAWLVTGQTPVVSGKWKKKHEQKFLADQENIFIQVRTRQSNGIIVCARHEQFMYRKLISCKSCVDSLPIVSIGSPVLCKRPGCDGCDTWIRLSKWVWDFKFCNFGHRVMILRSDC